MAEKKIVAYADPWSVRAGDCLDVMVSCEGGGHYQAELVELISGDSRPHGTGFRERVVPATFAGSYPARRQVIRPGSYAVLPDVPAAERLSFCIHVYPTLLARSLQPLAWGDGLTLEIREGHLCARLDAGERLTLPVPMRLRRWHQVLLTYDAQSGRLGLSQRIAGEGVAEVDAPWETVAISVNARPLAATDWLLAARLEDGLASAGFNGRLEAPRLVADVITTGVAEQLQSGSSVTHVALLGAWDFAREISSDRLVDLSPARRHGRVLQAPTRGVKGRRWDGTAQSFKVEPSHYGAIHFHEDDLADAGWQVDISWRLPGDLPSGVYAVKLTMDDSEDYVPFFVRPAPGAQKSQLVYLAATATYLAYGNQRLSIRGGITGAGGPRNAEDRYLLGHPEVGLSLYEHHADGSGVHFSSRLRPILNMKPKTLTWSFNADTNITSWLRDLGEPFDVVTDEDLHREGPALLADYRVVITGTHPEYYSTAMRDGLEQWLARGGRLMYMGGNGFYWRIAYHPENPALIEVRRAEDGTRAWIAEPGEYYQAFNGEYGGMWRRLGRPPNQLVGVGFAAQGFDGGTYYRLGPDAEDERAEFILRGVRSRDVIGDYGTQGGGAAGEEIDRYDASLGSPVHALRIASSENHRPGMLRVKEEFLMMQPELQGPKVRADMVFFETPGGGAVFSTGSISYAGALAHNGYDNDIARITTNVLRRFLDETPFRYP